MSKKDDDAIPPSKKDLLDIASLSVEEIEYLLKSAGPF